MRRHTVGLVMLGVFCCALRTLAPDVGFQDSAELVASAAALGIPHPPGYPLWTLMAGALRTILPLGNVAFRTALLSGLLAAAAAGVAASLTQRLLPASWPVWARTGGLIIGLTTWITGQVTWSQSVVSEVYALNVLLLALCLFFLHAWAIRPCPRLLLIAGFWLGLALSHHHTTVVFLPFIAWLVWVHGRPIRSLWAPLLRSAALIAVGLAVYEFLPLRARACPSPNWGEPSSFSNFLWHATRQEFGPFSFYRSGWILLNQLSAFWKALVSESGPLFILLGSAGLWILWRRRLSSSLVVLWVGASLLAIFLLNYSLSEDTVQVASVFFIPWHLFIAMGAGMGVAGLLTILCRVHRVLAVVGFLLLSLFPVLGFSGHLLSCSSREDAFAEALVREGFQGMSRRSVLFLRGEDVGFIAQYLQSIGYREDVFLVQRPALFFQVGYPKELARSLQVSGRYPVSRTEAEGFASLWSGRGQIKGRIPDEVRARREALFNTILAEAYPKGEVYWDVAGDEVSRFSQMIPCGLFFRILPEDVLPALRGRPVSAPWRTPGLARAFRNPLFFIHEDALQHAASLLNNVGAYWATQFSRESRERAIAFAQYALHLVPDLALAQSNLGTYLMGLGRQEEGVDLWKKAIRSDPGCVVAYQNLGAFHLQEGNLDEALSLYERLLSLDLQSVETRLQLAYCTMKKGWNLRASDHLAVASQLAQGSAESLATVGRMQMEMGRLPSAVEAYQRAIALEGQSPEYRQMLAEAFFRQGQYPESVAQYLEALKVVPDGTPREAELYSGLGGAYAMMGSREQAQGSLLKAVSIQPQFAKAHHNLGTLFLESGEVDRAISELQRAAELDPQNGMASHALGVCFEKKEDWQRAKEAYAKALEGALSDPASTWVNLGACCARLGEVDMARACWTRALEIKPDQAEAARNLESLKEMTGG